MATGCLTGSSPGDDFVRVVVCTDRLGGLSSLEAGRAIGRAFSDADARVAVVPMGVWGADLAQALASLGSSARVVGSGGPPPAPVAGVDPRTTSTALGIAIVDALRAAPRELVVDLTGLVTHDGGAGLLAALGADADVPLDAGAEGLTGLARVDLDAARALVAGTRLVAVVPDAEASDLRLGLRGVTARRGHAVSADPALLLEVDDSLGRLARACGVADAPGVGAAGGAALAVLALGGELVTGTGLCARVAGLAGTVARADVVVTGADTLGFADRGGPVVRELSGQAEASLRPCVAVARTVAVSGRELRTFGVEAAYALGGEASLSADELTRRASTVAASWTW